MRTRFLILFMVMSTAHSAGAWHQHFHAIATRAAINALPDDVPAFFRNAAEAAAHHAIDPDLVRDRTLPQLRAGEGPEHYFDLEFLKTADLPGTRYEFIAACQKADIKPTRAGMLPYAIAEQTQRLIVAFAEHRRWPGNRYVRQKCLVRAGTLAHYAQDACQPLHTTIHFDGRTRPDGSSPHSGIHQRMDALIDRMKPRPTTAIEAEQVEVFDDLLPAILAELRKSHTLADRVYTLEADLPATGAGTWEPTNDVRQLAEDRLRAATRFTASLWVTAWRKSADFKLAEWLDRGDKAQ